MKAIFINKYGEFRSGWALVLLIAVLLLAQFLPSLIIGLIVRIPGAMAFGTFLSILLMVAVQLSMIGGTLLLFRLLYKRPLRELGLIRSRWAPQLIHGGLLGIASIGLAFLILLVTGQGVIDAVEPMNLIRPLFWYYLLQFILVGFSEEIMTRGYLMTALKTTRCKPVIYCASAVIFALLHIMNDNVTVLSLVNIALVGILFAYLFVRSGKLWLPIGYHITWNFFQGVIFGMNVSGGGPAESLIRFRFVGADWITGGDFGAEGGVVATIVILLGLVYTRFFVKEPEAPGWTVDSDLPLTRGALPAGPAAEETP